MSKELEYDFDPTTDVKKAKPWESGIKNTKNFELDPESFGGEDFPCWDPNTAFPMKASQPLDLGPIVSPEDAAFIKKLYDDNPQLSGRTDYTVGTQRYNTADAWIQTYSGRRFNPTNPVVDSIVIQDIAHSLSMQCRFSGHVRKFYSVAQHCVMVSYICNFEDAFWGLMHDASEAYLVDVPRPLKHSGKFGAYIEFETQMQAAICKRFGLPETEPPSVKKADKILLATEARDLMGKLRSDWIQPCDPLPFKIEALSQQDAKDLFMKRFFELTNSPSGYEHYLSTEERA